MAFSGTELEEVAPTDYFAVGSGGGGGGRNAAGGAGAAGVVIIRYPI